MILWDKKSPVSYTTVSRAPLPVSAPRSDTAVLSYSPPRHRLFVSVEIGRNEQLKAEEASFRQARENLLRDLEKRVKAAKTALATASTALKKQQRLSKVKTRHS